MSAAQNSSSQPLLWRRLDWCKIVGDMSPATFYREHAAGHIQTVKIGSSTRVVTPPEKYIATKIAAQAKAKPSEGSTVGDNGSPPLDPAPSDAGNLPRAANEDALALRLSRARRRREPAHID